MTNDDGIESKGLHALVEAVRDFGDVTVVAPAFEYSGSGAALGTLDFHQPTVRRRPIEGMEDVESWTVEGPPGLCVMYAQLEAFGPGFDYVVSGINPGQNVGWSVYHSGTIGACLTGRNRGASGLAVSMGFDGKEVEGQTWGQIVDGMRWPTAATVARHVFAGMVAAPSDHPTVINLNVPNKRIVELDGWAEADVGSEPPRRLTKGRLVPDEDGGGEVYRLQMDWGSGGELVPGTDGYHVANRTVSITWLGQLGRTPAPAEQGHAVGGRLDSLFADPASD